MKVQYSIMVDLRRGHTPIQGEGSKCWSKLSTAVELLLGGGGGCGSRTEEGLKSLLCVSRIGVSSTGYNRKRLAHTPNYNTHTANSSPAGGLLLCKVRFPGQQSMGCVIPGYVGCNLWDAYPGVFEQM